MKKLNILLAITTLIGSGAEVKAQEENWHDSASFEEENWHDSASFEEEKSYSPCCSNFPLNIQIGYTSPEGIGRKDGYTTLAVSTCPAAICGCLNPFLDFRLHYLDNCRWAGNFGVGFQINDHRNKLRGYIYYDFRDTAFRLFNQVTVGVDWLTPCLDLRVNTYWPTTDTGNPKKKYFFYEGGERATRIQNERAWKGVEFDASKHYCFWNHDFYVTSGTYVFFGRKGDHSAAGGKLRLETEIFRNLGVAVQYSCDSHFHSRVYGQITWELPFGRGCCDETSSCCEPIYREEIIVIDKKKCRWKTNY